jgi:hypothetical protein
MILIHMPTKLSTTLHIKEGLTYLMVKLAYHLPYTMLTRSDDLGRCVVERKYDGGCWVFIYGHVDHHRG